MPVSGSEGDSPDEQHPSAARPALRSCWARALVALGIAGMTVVGGLYVTVRRSADLQPTEPADVIIVLGAGCEQEAQVPKRVYRNRLRHAQDLFERGMADCIIVTECSPAAEIAREYLVDQGVPESAVEVENRSATTYENLQFAQEIMQEHEWTRAIVVSDGFHLWRTLRMCDQLGLEAEGAATPYSHIEQTWWKQVNYTLREVVTYLIYRARGY